MKKTLPLLFLLLIANGKILAAPYITIGDLKLFKAYSPESPVQLREYLPVGETFNHWNRLASVRVFKDQKDPKKYLDTLGQQVVHSSPAARAQLLKNDKTQSLVLDFMTFSLANPKQQFAEWNLMRAKYVKGQGLVVYQYAVRYYTIDKNMPAAVIAERNKMVTPFAEASFEEKEDTVSASSGTTASNP